jgi:Uma2 family endonuclease
VEAVQVRRWTREEYERLVDVGLLRPDERVELIEGEIVQMPPQHSRHSTGVRLAEEALRSAFGPGFEVRTQLPLALGDYTEPEPDVVVVAGSPRDFADAHPTTAILVVEVSDATLRYDRETKASLYARAGIPEYWLVNLVYGRIEISREPTALPETPYGFGYRTQVIALPGEHIDTPSPSGARVAVDDLLP